MTGGVVRPARRDDAARLAALHRAAFPHYANTRLGTGYCTAMYAAYLADPAAFVFVVEQDSGMVGLCVGGPMALHVAVDRSLRGHAARALVARPWLWVGDVGLGRLVGVVARRLRRRRGAPRAAPEPLGTGRRERSSGGGPPAKLILVAVAGHARGSGAARALLDAFRAEATRRGYAAARLVVAQDNARARRAYEREGWRLLRESAGGAEYEVSLAGARSA